MNRPLLSIGLLLACCSLGMQSPPPAGTATSQPAALNPPATQRMRDEAKALRRMMQSDLGRTFLDAAGNLPTVAPRTIHREKQSRRWFSDKQMREKVAAEPNLAFDAVPVDEDRYYDTKYGTPIAYARLFDLLGMTTAQKDFAGQKILDFGYGTIGHLRMLASSGASVTGLDVDSFLTALYSEPTDTGVIKNPASPAHDGSIALVDGRFSNTKVIEQVGSGYDLIISKNTLKRGYVHPPAGIDVDKRMLIDLGVDETTFLQTLFAALKPGGHFAIYNISPKQNDYQHGEKYLPMADGLCPFERETLEKIGFRVVILDRDDSEAVRTMAHILGWDKGEDPMDLEHDLFAHFTVLEKPAR